MNYLLLFCTDAQEPFACEELPEEAPTHRYVLPDQWMYEQHSQIPKNPGSHLPLTVANILFGLGGQYMTTDGPFLEGTEVIGGLADVEIVDLKP